MQPAIAEWRAHWPMVMACSLGVAVSTVTSQTIGLFLEPMGAELGWTRTQISAGLMITAVAATVLSPLIGAAVDRWGSRRVALPSLLLTGLAMAAFGLVRTVEQWIGLWIFYALASAGIKLMVWTTPVSRAFSASRGLAIAFTVGGSALAGIIAPPIAYFVMERFGWRAAFIALGIGWASVTLMVVALFLRIPAGKSDLAAQGGGRTVDGQPGLTMREALRSGSLWRVALSTIIVLLFAGTMVVHQIPILTEAGVSRGHAAFLASLAATSGLFGKLATGWLMDRVHASRICGATLAAAAVAFTLLMEPLRNTATIVIAMIVIGYAGGAKLQITAYLTGRYGGLRNYGKIFGVMSSIIVIGGGLGPLIASAVYDRFGSYTLFLFAGIPGSLISGILLLGLGPYPRWGSNEGTAP
jgi:MFS family permease